MLHPFQAQKQQRNSEFQFSKGVKTEKGRKCKANGESSGNKNFPKPARKMVQPSFEDLHETNFEQKEVH